MGFGNLKLSPPSSLSSSVPPLHHLYIWYISSCCHFSPTGAVTTSDGELLEVDKCEIVHGWIKTRRRTKCIIH